MKKSFLFVSFLALALSCSQSGKTEQSQENLAQKEESCYKIVKVLKKGGEEVVKFESENDSTATLYYVDKSMKEMFEDQGKTIKKAYLISPTGDTLNSDANIGKMMKYYFNSQK